MYPGNFGTISTGHTRDIFHGSALMVLRHAAVAAIAKVLVHAVVGAIPPEAFTKRLAIVTGIPIATVFAFWI